MLLRYSDLPQIQIVLNLRNEYHRSTVNECCNDMMTQNVACSTCADNDGKGRGYFYAIMTAVLCPCHLPVVGLFLGTGAAGAFFAEHFIFLAIFLGILSLVSFSAAVRVLL